MCFGLGSLGSIIISIFYFLDPAWGIIISTEFYNTGQGWGSGGRSGMGRLGWGNEWIWSIGCAGEGIGAVQGIGIGDPMFGTNSDNCGIGVGIS